MKLVDQAQKLLELIMQPFSEDNDKAIQELEVQLTAAITTCVDVTELIEIVSNVEMFTYFPIPLVRKIYERLFLLAPNDWRVLAGFGAHLSMYSDPDSADERRADLFIEAANRLKAEQAE